MLIGFSVCGLTMTGWTLSGPPFGAVARATDRERYLPTPFTRD